jgi:hypothetical protein
LINDFLKDLCAPAAIANVLGVHEWGDYEQLLEERVGVEPFYVTYDLLREL